METSYLEHHVEDCFKLFGYSWDECGYCHGSRGVAQPPSENSTIDQIAPIKSYRSYYAQAMSVMKPRTYEALMCRGWRRSGTIIYLPNNAVTCCPQHTIRLPLSSNEFQPNKEQKKVLRKLQTLLQGRHITENHKKNLANDTIMNFLARNGTISELTKATENLLVALLPEQCTETLPRVRYKVQSAKDLTACVVSPICLTLVSRKTIDKKDSASVANNLVQRLQTIQSLANLVTSISCTTAGMIQIEVPVPEEAVNGQSNDPLKDWFVAKELPVPIDRTIKVKTLPAVESASLDPRVHKLYWDYQAAVHGDKHPMREPSTDDPSSIDMVNPQARAMLERTYESERMPSQAFTAFWDFLVDSPMRAATVHQQYTIGEAMVAVGVLDILPTGVSSVYCFYDPSFSKLVKMGTYAALKEIEYTRSLNLPYYYLGYFIESNPKMNYKGDYKGSQIRCSTTGQWVDVEPARSLLKQDERASLGSGQPPILPQIDVGTIPLLTPQGIIYGNMLQDSDKQYLFPFLEEWANLAGPESASTATIDMTD